MTSFNTMKSAVTKSSSVYKTEKDFLEATNTQKEINTVLVKEYLLNFRKFLFNSNLYNFSENNYFFIVFGILFTVIGFFIEIFISLKSLSFNLTSFLPYVLFAVVGFGLYFYTKYFYNIFKCYGISLRDNSPENIQKIYETFYILLNSQDLKENYNRNNRENYDDYDKRKVLKDLAEAIDKKYFIISPVLKLSKRVESVLYKKLEEDIESERKINKEKQRESRLDKHLSLMNKSTETTDDVRKDILLKALNKMN